ncbi:hypothetical protein GF373_13055 [bacterium]|nr:hypothetical protein [bacterium]
MQNLTFSSLFFNSRNFVVACLVFASQLAVTGIAPQEASLFIHVWHGDHQTFGRWGHPQRWVNILGHVSPASRISSLTWSLNGSPPCDLSFKEDNKRLARDGDFNIEIARSQLQPGENLVRIVARDCSGRIARRVVTVTYIDRESSWPLPYRVNWSTVERIQDVVQVVDGKWTLTDGGIRTVERYYDRVLAFGDDSWENYEVSTSVIFHAFTPPSKGPNTTNVTHVAIASRWPGHDMDAFQPHVKWYPLGATSEFRIGKTLRQCRWRIFDGKRAFHVESDKRRRIQLNKTYGMKHRVETLADGRSLYRVKMWPYGESEPASWDLARYESGDLASGSALLIAHHTDVTFGDIWVTPIEGE